MPGEEEEEEEGREGLSLAMYKALVLTIYLLDEGEGVSFTVPPLHCQTALIAGRCTTLQYHTPVSAITTNYPYYHRGTGVVPPQPELWNVQFEVSHEQFDDIIAFSVNP